MVFIFLIEEWHDALMYLALYILTNNPVIISGTFFITQLFFPGKPAADASTLQPFTLL